jgi:hypothetical protein
MDLIVVPRCQPLHSITEAVVAGKPMPGMTNPNGTTYFHVAKEVKKVALDELFPERHALIGAGLDPK